MLLLGGPSKGKGEGHQDTTVSVFSWFLSIIFYSFTYKHFTHWPLSSSTSIPTFFTLSLSYVLSYILYSSFCLCYARVNEDHLFNRGFGTVHWNLDSSVKSTQLKAVINPLPEFINSQCPRVLGGAPWAAPSSLTDCWVRVSLVWTQCKER